MYSWQMTGAPSWDYEQTEHPCPQCGQGLLRVDISTMLACSNNDHGPYFLV